MKANLLFYLSFLKIIFILFIRFKYFRSYEIIETLARINLKEKTVTLTHIKYKMRHPHDSYSYDKRTHRG